VSAARVLVTGAAGFVGRHIVTASRALGAEVATVVRTGDGDNRTFVGDLVDGGFVAAVLERYRPTHVVHAAGAVARSPGGDLGPLLEANVRSLHVLLRSVAAMPERPRTISLSSSAVYGAGGGGALSEDSPVRPVTAYGLSKAAGEEIARCYRELGVPTTVVRPFNLLGPGVPRGTLLADVARQLRTGRVRVGNLDSGRDVLDVRDAAAAIASLTLRNVDVECVNVGSGQSQNVRGLVQALIELTGTDVIVEETTVTSSDDVKDQMADVSLLRSVVPDWVPTRAVVVSLRDFLEDWRKTAGDDH
jgi:GDP-4-dehydro-6-deoxy-D-mannose reductase